LEARQALAHREGQVFAFACWYAAEHFVFDFGDACYRAAKTAGDRGGEVEEVNATVLFVWTARHVACSYELCDCEAHVLWRGERYAG
jgi:hypothetical protein